MNSAEVKAILKKMADDVCEMQDDDWAEPVLVALLDVQLALIKAIAAFRS